MSNMYIDSINRHRLFICYSLGSINKHFGIFYIL